MNLSKKLLTLLAIFCVIASAGVVCAEDNSDMIGISNDDVQGDLVGIQDQDDGGWAGSQYNDTDGGWAGSQYNDTDGGWAGSQYNDTDGGWAGSQYNETAENATVAQNTTENSTANATAPHSMLATGNPILLIGIAAAIGGAALVARKK